MILCAFVSVFVSLSFFVSSCFLVVVDGVVLRSLVVVSIGLSPSFISFCANGRHSASAAELLVFVYCNRTVYTNTISYYPHVTVIWNMCIF